MADKSIKIKQHLNVKNIAVYSMLTFSIAGIFYADIFVPNYKIPTMDAKNINKTYDGNLVHVIGNISSKHLNDPIFKVEAEAQELTRVIKIYQYDQADQKMLWSEDLIKDNENKNPTSKLLTGEKWQADNQDLGAFNLSPSLSAKLNNVAEPIGIILNNDNYEKLGDAGKKAFKLADNSFYFGLNPNEPQIGDIKVEFLIKKYPEISVLAKQNGKLLEAFHYKSEIIEKLAPGHINLNQMGNIITIKANPYLVWIIRAILLIPIFISLALIISKKSSAKVKSENNEEFSEENNKPKKKFSDKFKVKLLQEAEEKSEDNLHSSLENFSEKNKAAANNSSNIEDFSLSQENIHFDNIFEDPLDFTDNNDKNANKAPHPEEIDYTEYKKESGIFSPVHKAEFSTREHSINSADFAPAPASPFSESLKKTASYENTSYTNEAPHDFAEEIESSSYQEYDPNSHEENYDNFSSSSESYNQGNKDFPVNVEIVGPQTAVSEPPQNNIPETPSKKTTLPPPPPRPKKNA